jgi:phosphoglycolate phosphatase-like HAD superfamily hydrolase
MHREFRVLRGLGRFPGLKEGPGLGRPMDTGPSRARRSLEESSGNDRPSLAGLELPMVAATSQYAEIGHVSGRPREPPAPRKVERGVVVFDLDGTLLDDLGRISDVAADVMASAFGTPPAEARLHYLATTGMPFEAQLAQLYPTAPAVLRSGTARTFHQRKVTEAYAKAKPFPEVPKLLKRLGSDGWTLAVSTGAETEMADLLLEREGLRFWFEDVLGSGEGTKREHLAEYRRRFPGVPIFLVGDSRFDMEAAASVDGVQAVGRASKLLDWNLSPLDLQQWGARWADYSLTGLPEALARLERSPARRGASRKRRSPKP